MFLLFFLDCRVPEMALVDADLGFQLMSMVLTSSLNILVK